MNENDTLSRFARWVDRHDSLALMAALLLFLLTITLAP